MKKLAVLCIAALGAALLVLGTAPSASAYPDLGCDVKVDHQRVTPGQQFTVTGKADAVDKFNKVVPESQLKWTFRWNGTTVHRVGHLVTATFTAPEVTKTRTIRLTGRVDTPLGPCVRHLDIQVIAPQVSPPGGGGLPGTGGPAFWLMVAGLLLLLGGGGAVVAGRRRS
jgi:LPXTG-motif cell wall-anchored protein